MRTQSAARFLVLALTVLLAADCATVIRRRTQMIPVTSSPAGATVFLNGVEQGVTPLELSLGRTQKSQVVRIESPGYVPVEIRPKRRVAGNMIPANILLGLCCAYVSPVFWKMAYDTGEIWAYHLNIGLRAAAFAGLFEVLDLGSKKGYEFQPTELSVTLKKAEGPLRVDTILLDADGFRNIKWIRVHRD